jgi:hypothetical protein
MGLADDTRKAYSRDAAKYFRFCSTFGVQAVPASHAGLQLFVSWLAPQRTTERIKAALAAVSSLHADRNLPIPTSSAHIRRMLGGVTRWRFENGLAPIPRQPQLPITHLLLLQILAVIPPDSLDRMVERCALCFMFYGALRPGEVSSRRPTRPSMATLTWANASSDKGIVSLTLTSSKTSQFLPVTVTIGRASDLTCPVAALAALRTWRILHGPSPSQQSFLFLRSVGRPLSYGGLTRCLKASIRSVGVDASRYGLRSFRIGAATAMDDAGVPSHVLAKQGRWSWSAGVWRRYTRSPQQMAALASVMAGTGTRAKRRN